MAIVKNVKEIKREGKIFNSVPNIKIEKETLNKLD